VGRVNTKKHESGILEVSIGEGKHRVNGKAVMAGKDLVVSIQGGERHHIGAVALAVPRSSLKDPKSVSATASVLTLTGHKEDVLAKQISLKISKELRCVTVVVVGIHIEKASKKDIEKMVANSKRATTFLIRKIKK